MWHKGWQDKRLRNCGSWHTNTVEVTYVCWWWLHCWMTSWQYFHWAEMTKQQVVGDVVNVSVAAATTTWSILIRKSSSSGRHRHRRRSPSKSTAAWKPLTASSGLRHGPQQRRYYRQLTVQGVSSSTFSKAECLLRRPVARLRPRTNIKSTSVADVCLHKGGSLSTESVFAYIYRSHMHALHDKTPINALCI